MSDSNNNRDHLMYLPLLTDLQGVRSYSWGSVVLAMLYREGDGAQNNRYRWLPDIATILGDIQDAISGISRSPSTCVPTCE